MKIDKLFKLDMGGLIYDITNFVFYNKDGIFADVDYTDIDEQVFKDQMINYLEIPSPTFLIEPDFSLDIYFVSKFKESASLFIPITDESFKLVKENFTIDRTKYEKFTHDVYKVTIGSDTFELGVFYNEVLTPSGKLYDEIQELDYDFSPNQVDKILEYIETNFTRKEE